MGALMVVRSSRVLMETRRSFSSAILCLGLAQLRQGLAQSLLADLEDLELHLAHAGLCAGLGSNQLAAFAFQPCALALHGKDARVRNKALGL